MPEENELYMVRITEDGRLVSVEQLPIGSVLREKARGRRKPCLCFFIMADSYEEAEWQAYEEKHSLDVFLGKET